MNLLVAAIAIAASTVSAPRDLPGWSGDYGAALQATRAAQRPLLVLIDRPEDPVNGSQEAVLRPEDEALADVLDEYTLCYVDATTEYGQRVASVFGVRQYPFAAVIDRDGRKILEKWTGTREAWQWTASLDNGQPNGNPNPSPLSNGYIARPPSNGSFGNGRTASRSC